MAELKAGAARGPLPGAMSSASDAGVLIGDSQRPGGTAGLAWALARSGSAAAELQASQIQALFRLLRAAALSAPTLGSIDALPSGVRLGQLGVDGDRRRQEGDNAAAAADCDVDGGRWPGGG